MILRPQRVVRHSVAAEVVRVLCRAPRLLLSPQMLSVIFFSSSDQNAVSSSWLLTLWCAASSVSILSGPAASAVRRLCFPPGDSRSMVDSGKTSSSLQDDSCMMTTGQM